MIHAWRELDPEKIKQSSKILYTTAIIKVVAADIIYWECERCGTIALTESINQKPVLDNFGPKLSCEFMTMKRALK